MDRRLLAARSRHWLRRAYVRDTSTVSTTTRAIDAPCPPASAACSWLFTIRRRAITSPRVIISHGCPPPTGLTGQGKRPNGKIQSTHVSDTIAPKRGIRNLKWNDSRARLDWLRISLVNMHAYSLPGRFPKDNSPMGF